MSVASVFCDGNRILITHNLFKDLIINDEYYATFLDGMHNVGVPLTYLELLRPLRNRFKRHFHPTPNGSLETALHFHAAR